MARTKIPIFLAAAVAGGLALGMPGAAAAQSVGFTVLPSGDGVYPPRPVAVENIVTPQAQPVCTGNNCNVWPQQNWQGWNWPQASTNNDTKTGNAQPIVAPGAGGPSGIAPVQNAAQQAAPEEMPAEESEEEEPEETLEEGSEEAPEEESGPVGEAPAGPPPAQAAGGQLPFTGAPMGVAAAGAGLLAVALGCTLLSARRRRSSGAE
ncbi:hypothetical protein IL992_29510 [Microbispora sp. NEAU-D428]|uniref:hypothetical protein n=1 Tax=Microbispora sitophila TaxID=2771537 RepID=UPI0018671F7A|nr:hypothetical protein [Microbispora sitophila]MBE3013289.1 hypothetical protein [Microbispora sitophila]